MDSIFLALIFLGLTQIYPLGNGYVLSYAN